MLTNFTYFRRQFHQRYMREFFIRKLFWQLFSSYVYVVKAAETTFVQKICTFNVDEIDYRFRDSTTFTSATNSSPTSKRSWITCSSHSLKSPKIRIHIRRSTDFFSKLFKILKARVRPEVWVHYQNTWWYWQSGLLW